MRICVLPPHCRKGGLAAIGCAKLEGPELSDTSAENQGDQPLFSERSRKDLGHLRFLAQFLGPYKLALLGAVVALVVAAGAMLGVGQAVRHIVDKGFSAQNADFIDTYFIALMGVVGVLAVATFCRFFLVSWLGERVIADLRTAVYSHVITLSPAFFEMNRSGEIASRLTADTTLIQTVVGSTASIALRNFLLLIGGVVLLVISSAKLALYVGAIVPSVILPLLFFGRRVRSLSRASQDRIADVGAMATEGFGATQTIQAFNHEEIDQRQFGEITESAFRTAVRRIGARAWLTGMVILFAFGAIDLVLWVGAKDVIVGRMSGGELAAFVFYAIMVAGAVGALSESYGDFQRAAGAAGRMMELVSVDPQIRAPKAPVSLPEPPLGSLKLDHVTFAYPTRLAEPALHDLSFEVRPGETVALVGPSGAGKTTVFQLLLRFYDPQRGSIEIDGVDSRTADPHELRARIGVVPQDTMIFADTALENIRYGRPDASDAEVSAAIKTAAAEEFLLSMPEGLETQLGERGVRLSGGQRQRIAIARAVLKNPPILLLDEATSALDAENERLVQLALERLMSNRTTIVIAHRLATVLKADRILVIDQGRLVASGTHDELIQRGGLYARLADLQFGGGEGSSPSVLSA